MHRSERFSRLVIVVVLTLAALATGRMGSAMEIQDPITAGEKTPPGQQKVDPPKDGAQIVNLGAPPVIEAGKKMDVAITATDKSGVEFIDVQFGSYRQRAVTGGKRVVNVVLTFQTREIGLWELRATPIGRDGIQGPTQILQVNVINSFIDLVAGGQRMPKIDPKYTLDTGGVIVVDYPNLPPLDPRPWWNKWEEKYAKPFDWQASCPGVSGITEKGEVLHCWLTLHPEVRSHIIWEDIKYTSLDQYGTLMGGPDPIQYDNWSFINKGLLDEYFYDAYNYLKSGATTYAGPPLPDVMPNVIKLDDAESVYTFFDGSEAKRLYMATIAHSLALEIGGFLPWSVTTYSADDLEVLFNSHHMVSVGYAAWTFKGQGRSHTGYRPAGGMDGGGVIPAPPVTTFNFLLANDMVRSNHINTVGQLLEWGRKHQIHIGTNGSGVGNYPTLLNDSAWHYRGDSPAARMMSLTLYEDPFNHQILGTGPMAWTDGCDGASSFLQHELRAVNIPVGYVYPMGGTAHSAPIFRTIDRTLSHGDDVYGLRWAKSVPEGPAQSLLIPLSKFNDWFYGPNITDPYHNVGRQVIELAMEWQANELLTRYCADKAANKTHANGSVYAVFSDNLPPNPQHYYTVQELEAMNLWGKLGAKAQKLGYCTP